MKSCCFCKGPVERQVIDYMAGTKGGYVLVSGLEVEKCTQCGEVYLDTRASERIDIAVSQAAFATSHLDVPVVSCGV
ncbi:MAG: YgiT-type zinc finger protein [Candidatus Hydrogenedentes bacterium]|nr:YgiT-type zinc finger protein [Candidatus Hydrogenedentota bacterium]